ncbi:MAG TPA: PCRF domain-containing protein, partial [Candidatus Cloacimonadota bacterium]|nr:PCRF domain-containing protein [Candidatus Cloacimonadota bacterium]
MIPIAKLEQLSEEYQQLELQVSDTSLMGDPRRYRELMRRFKELGAIVSAWDQFRNLEQQLSEARHIMDTEKDPDLVSMAREEIETLETDLQKAELLLKDLLIPNDPNDEKNAIIEIRAGTGGEEAALFVADLYRMYSYYAERKGWKLQLLDANDTGLGGYKEIIFLLSGEGVYGLMRFESGVHRVQRIPVTESSGRIHTSAVSV